MEKYGRLRRALVSAGLLGPDEITSVDPCPVEPLLAVHDHDYVAAVMACTLSPSAARRIGLPCSPAFVARARGSVAATLAATAAALEDGFAGNLSGGTHHAHHDFGSGYCAFNDLAVAARWLLDGRHARRVLIFDVDVHQGDGTAALFAGDPRIFTCSVHGAGNFPFRKVAGDLDLDLPDGTPDEPYLAAVTAALSESLRRARPDVVLVQGGVDPLAADRLGRLAVTPAGLHARDLHIMHTVRAAGLPVVYTLGGGYAEPIDATIEAHLGTYRAARAVFG
jgi:acetoin utilization deacetylase AcuC-like enzyme